MPEPEESSRTSIIKAILAALTAILVAAIPAYLAYQQTLKPAELSLRATQTAETRRELARATQTAEAKLRSDTRALTPTPRGTTPAPTPPATLAPIPTVTITTAHDWQTLVRTSSIWAPCELAGSSAGPLWRVMPDYIHPDKDATKALGQIKRSSNGEARHWKLAPPRAGLLLKITSITGDKEWIEFGREASVSVTVKKDTPNHVNVLWSGCPAGGGGFVWMFRPGSLKALAENYQFQVVPLRDVDYFSLEPGEFEEFGFSFACRNPGVYQLKIGLPYTYRDQKGTITINSPSEIVCPTSFTTWEITPNEDSIVRIQEYTWKGSSYRVSS